MRTILDTNGNAIILSISGKANLTGANLQGSWTSQRSVAALARDIPKRAGGRPTRPSQRSPHSWTGQGERQRVEAMTKTPESQVSSPLAHGNSGKDWSTAHAELERDAALWSRLNWLGIHQGSRGLMEMRECPSCGSQISRPISMTEALDRLARISGVLHRTLDCVSGSSELARVTH